MPDPINNQMFGPSTNQMADLSTNQLIDPSTNQMTDLNSNHSLLSHQMIDPMTNPMADPSTYYELANDPLADPSTYFGPPNSHMAGPNGYYGPPVNQMAGPGPYYGLLNHQMAGPNGYYGPGNPQMAGLSTYYGPVNHPIAAPNSYFGLVNPQVAGPNSYFGMPNQQYIGPSFEQDDEASAYIQNLSNQLPINDAWAAAAAISEPTDSPQLNTNGAVCMQQKSASFADGDTGYDLEESSTAAARPPQAATIRNKKAKDALDSEPYIKKPPNAFMLFMQEQRPKVVSECNIKNNAAVNAILGKRWKSMSREEQAPYYEQACKEKLIHIQQHPNWCHMDNYGRKRKRVRGKAALRAKARCEEESSESKRGLKSLQMGGIDAEQRQTPTSGALRDARHHSHTHMPELGPISMLDPSRRSSTLPAPPSSSDSSTSDTELVSLTQAEEFLKMLDDIELPDQAARTHAGITDTQSEAPHRVPASLPGPPKTTGRLMAASTRRDSTARNTKLAERCANRGDCIRMLTETQLPSPTAPTPAIVCEMSKGNLASLLHPPHVSEFCHVANHEDELQLILEHLGYQQ